MKIWIKKVYIDKKLTLSTLSVVTFSRSATGDNCFG